MGISHSKERRTLEDHQSGRTAKCIWRAGPANENEEAHEQADLAAKVQTTGVILEQDAISRIESGSRMVQDYELRALAEVLGVTSDWLMDDEEKINMP